MDVKQLMLPGKIVKKSNALARAKWPVTSILEPRLVALLASQIKQSDIDFSTYEIRIFDLINVAAMEAGKHSGQDYKDIENAVDKLMGRIITIETESGWKKYNLFSTCELDKAKNILKICFHPDLKEHYLQLKQYIKYNLLEFMLLPSIYSQRLFEYLKSWDDKKEKTVKISDLHEMLDTPKTFRENFKNFRIRVLEKAHKDINEKTSLSYEWEPIKNGRAVSEIKFKFCKNKKSTKITMGEFPEAQPQGNISYLLYEKFLQKFPNSKNNRFTAYPEWNKLHELGKAPLAEDVPEDNALGIMEFLKNWQDKKGGQMYV